MGNPPETPPPPQGEHGALLDEVHFAERWDEGFAAKLKHLQTDVLFTTGAVVDEAARLLVLCLAEAVRLTTGSLWAFVAILLAALVVSLPPQWARRRRKRGIRSDVSYRVRVVGAERELARLRSINRSGRGPLREPDVFRISSAVETELAKFWKLTVPSVAVAAGLIALELLLTSKLANVYISVSMGFLIGRLTRAFLWPTYLRVSPGRLDVLQYPFLGASSPRIRTYDLSSSVIALEVAGPLTVFRERSGDGELFPSATSFFFDDGALEFETCILAAAFAPVGAAAALPEHALVG